MQKEVNTNQTIKSAHLSYGELDREQKVIKQRRIDAKIAKSWWAFWSSGILIILLLGFECYTINKYFNPIIQNNSWHVILIFIIGFNSLILGLLYFNHSSWSNKKLNYSKGLKEAIPLLKLLNEFKK